jgi:Caspase domain
MLSPRKSVVISRFAVLSVICCAAFVGANYSQNSTEAVPKTRSSSQHQRRWALVIGNQNYIRNPLRTSANDARVMAEALGELGFEVVAKENLATKADMESAVQEFEKKLKAGGVGLFYYAGHAIQINSNNYLVPVNADIRTLNDLSGEALDIRTVYRAMQNDSGDLKLIILDACRNNLLPPISPDGGRSISLQGLAPPGTLAPNESIIAYATDPNTGAPEDTLGDHSRYTRALLKYIRQPGLRIEDFFKLVKSYVSENTDGYQRPWTTSSVSVRNRDVYFREPAYITAAMENADDELIAVVNGEVVMAWTIDQRNPKSIPLKLGRNTLVLSVYNARTFSDIFRLVPEGWSYKIRFNSKDNLQVDFEAGENRPQTGGPRHGKMFAVATATIIVDEKSGKTSFVDINKEIWRQ